VFELILLIFRYAVDELISATFPFKSLCYWMTALFVFINSTSLFIFMLVLVNMEIVVVKQLCSSQND
jgi:hypothetical protein